MTTKPPPALVGTDVLIRVRLALAHLSNLSRTRDGEHAPIESLRVIADSINACRAELESLLARGPSIEPRYMLDAEQVRALVRWANQDYQGGLTAYGADFDAAMNVAKHVRIMNTATAGDPLPDAVEAYERADLERHARDLRSQVMLMASRLRSLRETAAELAAAISDPEAFAVVTDGETGLSEGSRITNALNTLKAMLGGPLGRPTSGSELAKFLHVALEPLLSLPPRSQVQRLSGRQLDAVYALVEIARGAE